MCVTCLYYKGLFSIVKPPIFIREPRTAIMGGMTDLAISLREPPPRTTSRRPPQISSESCFHHAGNGQVRIDGEAQVSVVARWVSNPKYQNMNSGRNLRARSAKPSIAVWRTRRRGPYPRDERRPRCPHLCRLRTRSHYSKHKHEERPDPRPRERECHPRGGRRCREWLFS